MVLGKACRRLGCSWRNIKLLSISFKVYVHFVKDIVFFAPNNVGNFHLFLQRSCTF
jgi:hypothetical protein